MALPVKVGQELLDVPFPEMVEKMALAIANGQIALDLNSIKTAQALATTMIPEGTVAVAIKETVDEDGNVTNSEIEYNDKEMPLLVFGINPTFYQFTDTIIEVKMAITMKIEKATSFSFGSKFSFENKTKFSASFKTRFTCWSKPSSVPRRVLPPLTFISTVLPRLLSRTSSIILLQPYLCV